MDCSLPDASIHGISQAGILEWAATSSSRGSSPPRDGTHVSCIDGFFTTESPVKPMLQELVLILPIFSIGLISGPLQTASPPCYLTQIKGKALPCSTGKPYIINPAGQAQCLGTQVLPAWIETQTFPRRTLCSSQTSNDFHKQNLVPSQSVYVSSQHILNAFLPSTPSLQNHLPTGSQGCPFVKGSFLLQTPYPPPPLSTSTLWQRHIFL